MPKIGTSYSLCVESIRRGEVAIEDVAFILTSTAYPDRDAMLKHLPRMFSKRHVFACTDIATVLWDAGLIFQSSSRFSTERTQQGIWVEIDDAIVVPKKPIGSAALIPTI